MKKLLMISLSLLALTSQAQPLQPTNLRELLPERPNPERKYYRVGPANETATTVWLVKPKPGQEDAIEAKLRGHKHQHFKHVGLTRLESKDNPSVLLSGLIEYAQPERRVSICDTIPNDPLWTNQWDMVKIAMPAAWDKWKGSGNAIVAVNDTGVDFGHPDLQANLYTDPANGTHGWQCFGGNLQPGGQDTFGHGTHVAGTIGAVANNALGMAGINWQVKIMSIAFLDAGGSGQDSDAIILINKMIELKKAGLNIVAQNCSWGGSGTDQALQDAFTALEAAGVISCVAAGNASADNDVYQFVPANFTNRSQITVLATTPTDTAAYFSDYGFAKVSIGAPGLVTLSTMTTNPVTLRSSTGYGYLSGTSMATPHVTGLAAFLRAFNPALTPAQTHDLILNHLSWEPLSDSIGQQTATGGRINAAKALNNPLANSPKLNGYPVITSSSPITDTYGGNAINVSFSASDPDGDQLRYAIQDTSGIVGLQFTNRASFTAPFWAIPAAFALSEIVGDGNGGVASSNTFANILPAPGRATNVYDVVMRFYNTNTCFRVDYLDNSTTNAPAYWTAYIIGQYGWTGWGGYRVGDGICYPFGLGDGSWVMFTETLNTELTRRHSTKTTFRINTADTHEFPVLSVAFDRTVGPAPLTVNYDFTATLGTNGPYYFNYNGGRGGQSLPIKGSLVLENPGLYDIGFYCLDAAGYVDLYGQIFSALSPSGGSITNPPPPPPGTNLVQVTDLLASDLGNQAKLTWTDRSTGEDRYLLEASRKIKGVFQVVDMLELPANAAAFLYSPASGGFYRFRVRAALGLTYATWSPYSQQVKL